MINIKNIKAEGFRSWHHLDFKLDRPGLTQVYGDTGSGKSSLIEAVVWALYGETLRAGNNVATRKSERPSNWKGTMASVDLTVDGSEVNITRYLDSKDTGKVGHKSALVLTIDGVEQQVVTKKQTQEDIIELIGLSFEAFSRAVVLPQRSLSLLNAKPEHQRDAIDALFDLRWLTKAKAAALADVQKYTAEIRDIEKTISELQSHIIKDQSEINLINQRNKHRRDIRDNIIDNLKNKIKDTKSLRSSISLREIDETQYDVIIDEIEKDYITLNEKLKKAEENKTEYEKQINFKVNDIQNYKQKLTSLIEEYNKALSDSNPEHFCKVCDQPINQLKIEKIKQDALFNCERLDEKKETVKSNLQEAEEHLQLWKKYVADVVELIFNYKETLSLLKIKLDINKQNLAKVKADIDFNRSFNSLIIQYDNTIKITEVELSMIENTPIEVEDTEKIEANLKINKQQLSIEENNLSVKKNLYKIASWWSVTGFGGRGGIREFVVNKMFETANEHIKTYAGALGLRLNIKYEKSSIKVKVLDVNNTEYDFEDLSGGEQQRLELMLTLTLHDIINMNSGINLLFLDEPTTNIDDNLVYDVFEILRRKNGHIFIITHAAVDGVGMNVIPVKKINKVSQII